MTTDRTAMLQRAIALTTAASFGHADSAARCAMRGDLDGAAAHENAAITATDDLHELEAWAAELAAPARAGGDVTDG